VIEAIWPPIRLTREWERLASVIGPAVRRDKKHDWFEIAGRLLIGTLQAWRVPGGYLVTELGHEALWVIYAAGKGGSLKDKRALLAEVETIARKAGCRRVRFENRKGWRRVATDYTATFGDGRWQYVKELT
jgi:hypothetical protein